MFFWTHQQWTSMFAITLAAGVELRGWLSICWISLTRHKTKQSSWLMFVFICNRLHSLNQNIFAQNSCSVKKHQETIYSWANKWNIKAETTMTNSHNFTVSQLGVFPQCLLQVSAEKGGRKAVLNSAALQWKLKQTTWRFVDLWLNPLKKTISFEKRHHLTPTWRQRKICFGPLKPIAYSDDARPTATMKRKAMGKATGPGTFFYAQRLPSVCR